MDKTIILDEVFYKKFSTAVGYDTNKMLAELLKGSLTENMYANGLDQVYHVYPQQVTVICDSKCSAYENIYAKKSTQKPSVRLLGDGDKIGEVEKIILANQDRIKESRDFQRHY